MRILIAFIFAVLISACSDYEDMYQNAYGFLLDEAKINYGYVIDSRDDQYYKTIKIGSQTWLAENLNYEYKVDKKTYGNFENSKHSEYGRYYTWAAAMDSAAVFSDEAKGCGNGVDCSVAIEARGVCLEGWHVPTREEFVSLWSAVGGQSVAGLNLKYRKGWDNGGDGNNSYGFSALPAGGYYKSTFLNVGENAAFWSASAFNSKESYFMDLHSSSDDANWNNHTKEEAYPVRCVKNVKSAKSSSSAAKSSSSSAKSSSSAAKSSSSVAKSSSSVAKSSSSNKASTASSSSAKTSANSSSSMIILSDSDVGTCAPTVALTGIGEKVTWTFSRGPGIDGASLLKSSYTWMFDGGTPSTSGKLSGASGMSYATTYFTLGEYAAHLYFYSPTGHTYYITCSTKVVIK